MLQQHLQDTYQYLFDEAQKALALGGSFRPFGAGTRKTGELIQTTVDASIGGIGPQDHVAGLISGFRTDDRESGLIVAGLVFDGQMTESGAPQGRALVFHLEAANGRALEVVIPYEVRVGGVIDFEAPVATEVLPEIFGAQQ